MGDSKIMLKAIIELIKAKRDHYVTQRIHAEKEFRDFYYYGEKGETLLENDTKNKDIMGAQKWFAGSADPEGDSKALEVLKFLAFQNVLGEIKYELEDLLGED